MTRSLKDSGLTEGASPRLLVHAGKLMTGGIAPRAACRAAVTEALTDDPELQKAIDELAASLF
jgi:nitric oxide reductase NorQ protein